MNNINIQFKKQRYSFKENTLCIIAGLSCICVLLYASILLYSFSDKVLGYLTDGIGVMNNAIRGGYR